jgi:aquaporin Z
MEQKLRMYLAELFGTFVLVFAGAGTLCSSYLTSDGRYMSVGGVVVAVALAEGFALAVVLTAIFPLTMGCCNPAITLTMWICNRLDAARAMGLIGMQALGSVLAGLTLRGLFSPDLLAEARLGMPHLRALLGPGGEITLGGLAAGAGLEFAFAFFLTVAVFASLVDKRAPRLGGLIAGLAQVVIVLVGFHLTGGAANPALYLGPAVCQLTVSLEHVARPFGEHPVYWGGPFLGAAAGGLFYTMVLLPETKK